MITTISFSTSYFTSRNPGTRGKLPANFYNDVRFSYKTCWKHFCQKYKAKKYQDSPGGRAKFEKCYAHWKEICPVRVKRYKKGKGARNNFASVLKL